MLVNESHFILMALHEEQTQMCSNYFKVIITITILLPTYLNSHIMIAVFQKHCSVHDIKLGMMSFLNQNFGTLVEHFDE